MTLTLNHAKIKLLVDHQYCVIDTKRKVYYYPIS